MISSQSRLYEPTGSCFETCLTIWLSVTNILLLITIRTIFLLLLFLLISGWVNNGTFADWDVLYCSVPTSPGGGYRSTLGRLVFKTKEMIQVIEAPDIVKNKVSFSAFGFLDGEVSLTGRLY